MSLAANEPGIEFSFGQIEAVCAALSRISSDKRVAFAGRLKSLQKYGIADRPGRGKAGTYSFPELMRFVVALELMQCGLMPQMAARVVNVSWRQLRPCIYLATFVEEGAERPVWYWTLAPEALRDMSQSGAGNYAGAAAIQAVPAEQVTARLMATDPLSERPRLIVLNGTAISKAAINAVDLQFHYATVQIMQASLDAEAMIDLDAEAMIDRQGIFDRMLAHLRKQGKLSIDDEGYGMYRAPDGCACAIGGLIPDERYSVELEGKAAYEADVVWAVGFEVDQLGSNDVSFLDDAQAYLHESLSDDDFETQLESAAAQLAAAWRLQYTPIGGDAK